jgi:hypothetical protein
MRRCASLISAPSWAVAFPARPSEYTTARLLIHIERNRDARTQRPNPPPHSSRYWPRNYIPYIVLSQHIYLHWLSSVVLPPPREGVKLGLTCLGSRVECATIIAARTRAHTKCTPIYARCPSLPRQAWLRWAARVAVLTSTAITSCDGRVGRHRPLALDENMSFEE